MRAFAAAGRPRVLALRAAGVLFPFAPAAVVFVAGDRLRAVVARFVAALRVVLWPEAFVLAPAFGAAACLAAPFVFVVVLFAPSAVFARGAAVRLPAPVAPVVVFEAIFPHPSIAAA